MSERPFDILIAGGGGIGSAIAYFLTARDTGLRVVVCERDPTYGRAATTLAAGGIRQQFTTRENVLMSQFGYSFMQEAAERLAVGDRRPDVALHPRKYLRLTGEEQRDEVAGEVEMQRSVGAEPEWLERDALAARFPWMKLEDIAFGVLGGPGEGLFDPNALLHGLRAKAIARGAEYVRGEVVGIERDAAGKVEAALLHDGTRLACGTFVNACGPQAGKVAALAGLELPVISLKTNTFVFKVQTPPPDCPIVLDHVQRLNFRPEGSLFIAAYTGERIGGDAGDDWEVDHDRFDEFVWPLLYNRSDSFEAIKQTNAWVGHMEWNLFDANPVIGRHPDYPSFVFAAGFSGHGAQHIPAAGRAIAELLLDGGYQTIDLTRLGYERLVSETPVRERV